MTITKLLFYLAVWLLLGIYLIPSFLQKTTDLMNDETLLVVSLGICFGMVWLADAIGFSSALGAFLAGSILAGTVHGDRIAGLVNPCKDLFGAVFFVSVGLKVVPSMLVDYLGPIVLLTVITIVGKIFLLTFGMMLGGEDLKTSLYGATSQTQIGEFSFIIATLGISLGVTSDFLYPIIVAVSVVTTFTTPYLIRGTDKIYDSLQRMMPEKWKSYMKRYLYEKKANNKKQEKDQDWGFFLKGYIETFLLYGIMLLGVAEIGRLIIFPALQEAIPWKIAAPVVTCIIVYIAMAPLLPPMMIFRKRYFTALWLKSYANHLPLMLLVGIRTAVTVYLVIRPVSVLLKLPTVLLTLIALPLIIRLSHSDWLIGKYLEMEARFLTNFNEKKLQEMQQEQDSVAHSWLDEQLQVASYYCIDKSTANGKRLKELQWGKTLQVHVIKIIRGRKHINIPEGYEELMSGDHIYIMGTVKALDNFRLMNAQKEELLESEEDTVTLHEFITHQDTWSEDQQLFAYAVPVKEGSDLIGSSIKDSGIKSEWSACLVGIERGMLPLLGVSPSFIINKNDLLWVIGTQKMGRHLVKKELV